MNLCDTSQLASPNEVEKNKDINRLQ